MSESSDDAKRTADAVVARDRRRIRSLAALAIGLWVIAALMIPSVYLPLGAKMKQYAKALPPMAPGTTAPTPEQLPQVVADLQHQQWVLAEIVLHGWIVGAIILAFALGTGILASICTVMLAMQIRRVTLRQVSANLADISAQLRQLQLGK